MTQIRRIICHIRTSSGARFSVHETEQEFASSLVEYWNEVHADPTSSLPVDTPLQNVINVIEEIEDVSWEKISITPSETETILAHDALMRPVKSCRSYQ